MSDIADAAAHEENKPMTSLRPPPFRIVGDRAALFKAFALARAEFTSLDAGNTAKVEMKAGGSYTFDYADLAAIQGATVPALTKHGLSIFQPWWQEGNGYVLLTILAHESGASMETETFFIEDGNKQALGSSLTYLQRYAWRSICGISASKDDDDGNKAVGNKAVITPKTSRVSAAAGIPDPLLQEVAALSRQLGFDRKAGEEFMQKHLRFVKPTDRMTNEELGKLIVAMTNELTEQDARGKIK